MFVFVFVFAFAVKFTCVLRKVKSRTERRGHGDDGHGCRCGRCRRAKLRAQPALARARTVAPPGGARAKPRD